ncbi:hypothetical protein ACFLTS_00345 [Chloroflexota bacterium]
MINDDSNNNGNMDFINQVRQRVERKVAEYYQLLHEQKRIEVQLGRTKEYIEHLNSFLKAEDQSTIELKEYSGGSIVGKPGNRSLDFPLRRVEWEGMTLEQITHVILNNAPDEIYHANIIAHKIYEIRSVSDLRNVKRGLVSMLRRGAKSGLWEFVPRNKYKAKATAKQERLVNV